MFFVEFIKYYCEFSILCLLKDIFFGEYNIIKYELQETINLYKTSFQKNLDTIGNLIPFFVTLEIIYYYSDEYSYIKGILQVLFNIYFSYFINILINLFYKENKESNNKLICVFNTLYIEPYDLYINYLVPVSFLTFTIGLNKFAIDFTFYGGLLFFFCRNSNFWNSVLFCETIKSYMKINEFRTEVEVVFNLIEKKYSKLTNREGEITIIEKKEN